MMNFQLLFALTEFSGYIQDVFVWVLNIEIESNSV